MAPLLGYWNVRGLGMPIRLMLVHAGVDFKEKVYPWGGPPDFNKDEWIADKATLPLDFPNLPYYMDDGVKLTQSRVIMRYLARKHGLNGKNDQDETRIDLLATQLYDYLMDLVKVVYSPDFLQLKDGYLQSMHDKLKTLTKFLGERKFSAGDYVTYADFILFEYFEVQLSLDPSLLKDYPILEQYHKRMRNLDSVNKYFNSPTAIKDHFFGAPAFFGGPYSKELLKEK